MEGVSSASLALLMLLSEPFSGLLIWANGPFICKTLGHNLGGDYNILYRDRNSYLIKNISQVLHQTTRILS